MNNCIRNWMLEHVREQGRSLLLIFQILATARLTNVHNYTRHGEGTKALGLIWQS